MNVQNSAKFESLFLSLRRIFDTYLVDTVALSSELNVEISSSRTYVGTNYCFFVFSFFFFWMNVENSSKYLGQVPEINCKLGRIFDDVQPEEEQIQ